MSDTHDTHAAGDGPGPTPVHDAGHGDDAHGDDAHGDDAHGAGHDDGHAGAHGHVSEPLGPIGWAMWGAGALGVLVAAVMTAVFAVATGFVLGG